MWIKYHEVPRKKWTCHENTKFWLTGRKRLFLLASKINIQKPQIYHGTKSSECRALVDSLISNWREAKRKIACRKFQNDKGKLQSFLYWYTMTEMQSHQKIALRSSWCVLAEQKKTSSIKTIHRWHWHARTSTVSTSMQLHGMHGFSSTMCLSHKL